MYEASGNGKEIFGGRNNPERIDKMTVDGERKLFSDSEVVNLDDFNV